MRYMMPGVRPSTWAPSNWSNVEHVFSGPVPSSYGLELVTYDLWQGRLHTEHLCPRAAFRLVLR
jgi:hypothetical protein